MGVQPGATRCNQVQPGATRCNHVQSGAAARCYLVQPGATRYNQVQSGTIRYNQVESGNSGYKCTRYQCTICTNKTMYQVPVHQMYQLDQDQISGATYISDVVFSIAKRCS